jgi:hypothetical protein
MSRDFEPIKIVRSIGAAANTGAVDYPLLCAGSNYLHIEAVHLVDRASMSGASGSAYMQATCYNRGKAGAGTSVVAQRKNNAAADYIVAYTPWAVTMSTTASYHTLAPGELLTLTVGGSAANGTFTDLVAQVDYAIGTG